MGTTDFMSVPYSLHAKTAANGSTTDELQTLSISGDTLFISNSNYIILPTPTLLGCMDSTAANYDPNANTDDGSCIIYGCTDSTAFNYNSSVNTDDGSCIYLGCTDSTAFNYNASANTDDGSCIIYGCTDSTAFNYSASANTDDGSCIPTVNGCTDSTAFNYNASANIDDGSCIIYGCTDSTAFNYSASANTDDSSCIPTVNGCTDSTAFNYNASANTDDGSCIGIGDTYQGGIIFYLDGNGGGLIAAPSNQGNAEWGCYGTLISGANYVGTAIGTGSQNTINIEGGCTTPGTAADICANLTLGGYSDWFLPSKDELNEMYFNLHQQGLGGFTNYKYWSSTEIDNVSAWYQNFSHGNQYFSNKNFTTSIIVRAVRAFGSMTVYGCTDPTATNYNLLALTDDGSCCFVSGCTDSLAFNYNSAACYDDGSCASAIGDNYQGGIIFYLDGNGGGLIAAPSDQGNAEWGCLGTLISGADGTGIGTGNLNTIDI